MFYCQITANWSHISEFSDVFFSVKLCNRVFQQAGPFLATSEQSNRETENSDHFFSLLSSVIPSFYTTLRKTLSCQVSRRPGERKCEGGMKQQDLKEQQERIDG
jgi:hypothetical protein